jgi:hypothetical protein
MKAISLDSKSVKNFIKHAKDMRDDSIEHRSFGWKPLYEPDENPAWVKDVLIPHLNKETGIKWSIAGNKLLHSETTTLFLPISSLWCILNGVLGENKALCKIKKKYPTLQEDNFGYKIEKRIHPKNRPRQHIAYEGFWALSIDNILERGAITGKKFGL